MKDKKIFEHHTYYFIELLMLLFGFFLIIVFSFNVQIQFMILMFLLLSYTTMGFIHHGINHNFSTKIVIEYLLISALILAGFLFLNIGRI